MTLRKPVNQTRSQPGAQAVPPTTPLSQDPEPAETTSFVFDGSSQELEPKYRTEGDILDPGNGTNPWQSSGANPWVGSHGKAVGNGLPSVLKPGKGMQLAGDDKKQSLPPVLQAGSTKETPRSSWESQRSTKSNNNAPVDSSLPPTRIAPVPPQSPLSTNPYHRPHTSNGKVVGEAGFGSENIADIWGDGPPAPQPPPVPAPLRHQFAEPLMKSHTSPMEQRAPGPEVVSKASENPWSLDPPATANTNTTDHQATEVPILNAPSPKGHGISDQPFNDISRDLTQSSNVTPDDSISLDGYASNVPLKISHASEKIPSASSLEDNVGPPLPPRTLQEKQDKSPPQPPRPLNTHDTKTNEAANTQLQREESAKSKRGGETYQIRHVNWYDASSPTNPRRSPIMVQNANGPCPLLALVNALVLSTPTDYATALVETLRVREQVSLGLLLDAVIDELIGRNGDLPDVSDMYAFLLALHTGMNANPRFVPLESPINLVDVPIEGDLSTRAYASREPGGFEETSEMKLYSTFAIPLIHGWIPPRNHPAFAALKRTARTYEDAQNLMFREEELEEKLQRQGLSSEEQVTLEDIASVKYFLSSTATQLTEYGLDTMTETMAPGSIAILFRNNHFSTLYRHPKSGQLLTLVTDMGFAGHDELVWESLVDVSGEGCEFFSGDFRPVSNNAGDPQQQSQSQGEEGWTTVDSRSRGPTTSNQQPSNSNLPPLSTLNINDNANPLSPNTEQEDHDLALAMQLQEEEEERDCQEAAARRREDELSQAYLHNSDASGRRTFPGFSTGATGAQGGPSPPPRSRGNGRGRGTPSSRPVPRRQTVDTEDAPPPTYEQAAKRPAYHPPAHLPYESPSLGDSTQRPPPQPRQSSAYNEHASYYGGSSRRGHLQRGSEAIRGDDVDPGFVRRRTRIAVDDDEGKDKNKDCIVM